ncbi:MAG: aminodeoxychorismate/anthranilate synthase component II [Succinivibrio sp.]|nr:aminodeoxychorismate/anthranilate synthase component II [Succinivibrio sp.]
MATIIFIDNFDSFTYNLVDEFRVLNHDVLVYRNDADIDFISNIAKLRAQNGEKVIFVLSPGPSSPSDANNLLGIIKNNLGKYPMLGICLGHQALGQVLGGKVVRADKIVHGKSSMISHESKHCFSNLPNPLKVARYHSLVVEDLGEDVEVLASVDNLCMSLYSQKYNVLGFQFHPESIMSTYGRVLLDNSINSLLREKQDK